MNVGVIYVGYNTADLIPLSLTPWVEARRARLGGNTFVICAVSVPFEGFDHGGQPEDNTRTLLGTAAQHGDIDHAIVRDRPMKETDARGAALKWLMDGRGVTHIVQWDSDEIATVDEIRRLAQYLAADQWTAWWRIPYRNAVFNDQTFLKEPFTPARVHRTHTNGGYVAAGFWDDNNVFYRRPWERDTDAGVIVPDVELAGLTIPEAIINPTHLTWLSNARSKCKCEYQRRRGWSCGYRWDEKTDSLRFNEEHYARLGLPLPEVITLPGP